MTLILAVLAGVALVATFMVSLTGSSGDSRSTTAPSMTERQRRSATEYPSVSTPRGHRVEPAPPHRYDVTTRYEHGETDLYIATTTGDPAEREAIRSLIYDAGAVEHADFPPPARVWHPDSVVFADEA